MNTRLKLGLLSSLAGALLFAVAALMFAQLKIAVKGSGAHGYGSMIIVLLPMISAPVGLLAGALMALFQEKPSGAGLQRIHAVVLGLFFLGLFIWLW